MSKKEWKNRNNYGNFEANKEFLRMVGVPKKGDRVLEIGFGRGGMLNYLMEKGCRVSGVEKNPNRIEEVEKVYENIPTKKVDGAELPYESNTFDIVISFDVLEHIPDTDTHLEKVRRVLKKGGSYLLQTPNKWTNTIFETIRHKSFTDWRDGHCSLHSFYELSSKLQEKGFKAEFYDVPVVNKFFKSKIYHNTGRLGLILLRIFNPDSFPRPLRTSFYVMAKKC